MVCQKWSFWCHSPGGGGGGGEGGGGQEPLKMVLLDHPSHHTKFSEAARSGSSEKNLVLIGKKSLGSLDRFTK